MSGGRLLQFATLSAWITAENNFLAHAQASGHTTIESLNGWYVQPASNSWLQTVLTTKQQVESLGG